MTPQEGGTPAPLSFPMPIEASAAVAEKMGRGVIADNTIALMFSEQWIRENPAAVALIKKRISDDPGLGFARTVRNMFLDYWAKEAGQIPSQLAKIKAPALIIAGDQDQLTPLPTQQALHEAIPGSRFEVIKGSGHVPVIEQPELWNRLALEFLEGVKI